MQRKEEGMRRSVMVVTVCVGVLVGGVVGAGPADLPHYMCRKALSPIVVDGHLEEFAWQAAERIGRFTKVGDFRKPDRSDLTIFHHTEAAMVWDEEYLYIGFACVDPDMWTTMTQRDDPLWGEEVVEVFIDPDGDGKEYAELEVNPLNAVVDLKVSAKPEGGVGWSSMEWDIEGLKTAVAVYGTVNEREDRDQGWTVEIAIPWTGLKDIPPGITGPPEEGAQWRINLYRIERPKDKKKVGDEYLAWSSVRILNFHVPERFGVVEFTRKW